MRLAGGQPLAQGCQCAAPSDQHPFLRERLGGACAGARKALGGAGRRARAGRAARRGQGAHAALHSRGHDILARAGIRAVLSPESKKQGLVCNI